LSLINSSTFNSSIIDQLTLKFNNLIVNYIHFLLFVQKLGYDIYLNFALYSSSFLFTKLLEVYAVFNPIVDVMPGIPLFFFLLTFVWQAAVSLR